MDMDSEKKKKAREEFQARADGMDRGNAENAAEAGERKRGEFCHGVPRVFRGIWEDVLTMLDLLRDWLKGDYDDAPWSTIASVAAAIAYFACPLDVIPDILPGLGFLDDVLVLKICLDLVEADLEAYREWCAVRETETPADNPEPDE